jgi:hypothetical protein
MVCILDGPAPSRHLCESVSPLAPSLRDIPDPDNKTSFAGVSSCPCYPKYCSQQMRTFYSISRGNAIRALKSLGSDRTSCSTLS